jgi:hypothetical protein
VVIALRSSSKVEVGTLSRKLVWVELAVNDIRTRLNGEGVSA